LPSQGLNDGKLLLKYLKIYKRRLETPGKSLKGASVLGYARNYLHRYSENYAHD